MIVCKLLSRQEFKEREQARHDAIEASRKAANDPNLLLPEHYQENWFEPGTMYECPWYHDPQDPRDNIDRKHALERIERGELRKSFLSDMYWRDWSDKRAPITVFCPNGKLWCIDQVSKNGDGWTVTGTAPNVTCHPSIVVPGYHGYLQNGVFTNDVDRPEHPNGVKEK